MSFIHDKLNDFFPIYAIFDAPNFVYWCSDSYDRWVAEGCYGLMDYMRRDGRGDLERVMKGAKTVVVVGKYYGDKVREDGKALFAVGEDYHVELKRELNCVLDAVRVEFPGARGRAVVDSAPIFEKALANYGGLGWVGRNSLIVNEKLGSWFNIGVLLLDVSLDEVRHKIGGDCDTDESGIFVSGDVSSGGCGECYRCVEACPMGAIRDDKMIDARNCISYQTIELPRLEGVERREICGWNYGCDLCQMACPYNWQ